MKLEYVFANAAFHPLAAVLREKCGATLVEDLTDPLGDTAYWDFKVKGQVLTLHYHYAIGTTLFNASPEGCEVLESLRPLLDVPAYPILQVIES